MIYLYGYDRVLDLSRGMELLNLLNGFHLVL